MSYPGVKLLNYMENIKYDLNSGLKETGLTFKRQTDHFPQEKSPITHQQCVNLTNTSYDLFLIVANYWSNTSHLILIWILLVTNDVEHLCMHFLAIGAPYL